MPSHQERIEGGLVGLLVGDALGVPYEFHEAAVALGDDTDTTAAVAGGIAGIRDGIGAIPTRWAEGLRGRWMFEPLLRRLQARAHPIQE